MAVDFLDAGEYGVLAGINRGAVTATPLSDVVAGKKPPGMKLLELTRTLAK